MCSLQTNYDDENEESTREAFPKAMSKGPFKSWEKITRDELLHTLPFADKDTCRSWFISRWRKMGIDKLQVNAWTEHWCHKVSR